MIILSASSTGSPHCRIYIPKNWDKTHYQRSLGHILIYYSSTFSNILVVPNNVVFFNSPIFNVISSFSVHSFIRSTLTITGTTITFLIFQIFFISLDISPFSYFPCDLPSFNWYINGSDNVFYFTFIHNNHIVSSCSNYLIKLNIHITEYLYLA